MRWKVMLVVEVEADTSCEAIMKAALLRVDRRDVAVYDWRLDSERRWRYSGKPVDAWTECGYGDDSHAYCGLEGGHGGGHDFL